MSYAPLFHLSKNPTSIFLSEINVLFVLTTKIVFLKIFILFFFVVVVRRGRAKWPRPGRAGAAAAQGPLQRR